MDSRAVQGDVLRDIEMIEKVYEVDGDIEISKIVFPLALVLTQDCDLEQEDKIWRKEASNHDKQLFSVLLAPVYNAEHVFAGEHLSFLERIVPGIKASSTKGMMLKQNEIPRYHYIEFPTEVQIVPSVLDFKHYFSANSEHIRSVRTTSLVCTLNPLFRENVSARFANYLSRIGLPESSASANRAA
jgi:hypothetical protein